MRQDDYDKDLRMLSCAAEALALMGRVKFSAVGVSQGY